MTDPTVNAVRAVVGSRRFDDVQVADVLPQREFIVRRVDLVRYAGASGDFNAIHWSDRAATSVGLPGVIAHGNLTMAVAVRVVTEWVGDPAAVLEYSARFTRPVEVPDDDLGTTLHVAGTVTEKLDDSRVRVELTATCRGEKVLGAARAVVRLA
jgi:acyl dehydratase